MRRFVVVSTILLSGVGLPPISAMAQFGSAVPGGSSVPGMANGPPMGLPAPLPGPPVPPPPVTPPHNIWNFLGVPHAGRGIGRIGTRLVHCIRQRLPFGNPPAPLGHAVPPGVAPSPGSAAVANAQKQEEAAKVAVEELKFLRRLGCGPCNPDVERTLFEALDSCAWQVRREAAITIRAVATSGCPACNSKSCCSCRIREKLEKLGYGRDEDTGCFLETHPEVRRESRRALQLCACLSDNCPLDSATLPEGPVAPAEEIPPPEVPQDIGLSPSTDRSPVRAVSYTRPQPTDEYGIVLARVRGEPIYEEDVMQAVLARLVDVPPHEHDRRLPELIRDELETAIDRKLVAQEAARQGFEPRNVPSLAAVQRGTPQWEAAVADAFLRHHIQAPTNISDAELQTFYREHRSDFVAPRAVRWESLTILAKRCASWDDVRRLAQETRRRIVSASDEQITTPTDRDKLRVERHDWTDETQLRGTAIGRQLLALQPGEVSPIVSVADGLCIVRVLESRPSRQQVYAEVRDRIFTQLAAERQQAVREQYVEILRRDAFSNSNGRKTW